SWGSWVPRAVAKRPVLPASAGCSGCCTPGPRKIGRCSAQNREALPMRAMAALSSVAALIRFTSYEGEIMPRYVIERHFPDGLGLAPNAQGVGMAATVIANNAQQGVTWVHSYVTPDKKRTYCVYDGPSPEAIRKVAERNGLPVERITEVRVL